MKLWLLFCSFFVATLGRAADNCLIIGIDSSGFKEDCGNQNLRNTNRSLPTFSDSFNLIPSSLPTTPTPFVVEGTYSIKPSSVAGADYHLGLVRGLENLGVGATSVPDNTFFDTNLVKPMSSTQYAVEKQSLLPTYNLGFALHPWNRSSQLLKFLPTLGYASKMNQSRGTVGHLVGLSTSVSLLSGGVSFLQEPETTDVPFEKTLSAFVGASLQNLSIDVSLQETRYRYRGLDIEGKTQVLFLNIALQYSKFIGSYSFKKIQNFDQSVNTLWMASLQYAVLQRLRILALMNYVPGAKSIGFQLAL